MDQSKIKFYEDWDGHNNLSVTVTTEKRPTDGQISSCLSLMGIRKRADERFRQYATR